MKKFLRIISALIIICLAFPYTSFAAGSAKNSKAVSVDSNGLLVSEGKGINGFYNNVFYQNGVRASGFNGTKSINGMGVYVRQGRAFTGIYGDRYYENGVWSVYMNGEYEVDGSRYNFVNGELLNNGSNADSDMSFMKRFNLREGPFAGAYYEDGNIDYNYTGYKSYNNKTYYVKKGKLYNGYFEGCMYKDGSADSSYSGVYEVNGEKRCFVAGYYYTGIFENKYYVDGVKADDSGYIDIDNVKYYLVDGEGANGVFDGAYFKNGLVDVTVNGKVEIDGVMYTFVNGITSDGLHDGKWYTDGKFDKNANGVRKYNGIYYFFKNGVLSDGVAKLKDKLRLFKNGVTAEESGWLNLGEDRYFFDKGVAASGVYKVGEKEYLFDSEGRLCKDKEAVVNDVVYVADEDGIATLAPQIFQPQLGVYIPYPHPATHPDGTISSSGCGVCSSYMIIKNSTTYDVTLEQLTQDFLDGNCRDPYGTAMDRAVKILERDYKITSVNTRSIEDVKEHLKKGYFVIANVGKVPLFSTSGGHFVVVSGMKDEDTAIIQDPSVRPGKYGSPPREMIEYNEEKQEVYAPFETLERDAGFGYFYLMTPTENIALRHSDSAMEITGEEAQN